MTISITEIALSMQLNGRLGQTCSPEDQIKIGDLLLLALSEAAQGQDRPDRLPCRIYRGPWIERARPGVTTGRNA